MQNELTKKLSFRENVGNVKNLLIHVYRIDRGYYALAGLGPLLDAVRGALALVLSADILEQLYASAGWEEIRGKVILLLGSSFLLAMASSVLRNEYVLPRQGNIARIYDGDLAAKFQQMDYSLMDSPYVRKLSERIAKANNWGGGIYSLFGNFDAILSGIWRLVCSATVALPILRRIFRSGSLWTYLGLAGLAALLWIVAAAEGRANAAYQGRLFAGRDDVSCPEELRRKYVYFIWYWTQRCLSGDYHFIKDVHLYDGYRMMRHYTSENVRECERVMPWAGTVGKLAGRLGLCRGGGEGLMVLAGYLVSAAYAMQGAMPAAVPAGDVVKFAGAVTGILTGVLTVIQNIGFQHSGLALTARKSAGTLELLRVSDEMYKGKLPVEKRLDNRYEIEFRHVSFRYPGTERYALKDLSLKLRIGERMAIVGMNGSGKTTMIKLLCRLYDPQEGEILLNGVDIRKFRQEEYLRLFSVVFQDFRLLALPLGENVAASLEVDGALAAGALEQAGLAGRLRSLPEGLGTYLYQDVSDRGVEISGGEAQKIAIARALYRDAPFVLLDEPTASLDPLSEYEIYSGFDAMVGGKTAVYISHRLASCRFCSDIAVFHEGRLVQRGSHEELLRDEGGKYYELWHAQAQYYTAHR